MPLPDLINLFFETLELIRKFRNRCAHGGRIFNYRPNKSLTYIASFHTLIGISHRKYNLKKLGKNDLYTLLGILRLLGNQDPYLHLTEDLIFHIDAFFKDDIKLRDKILQEMNLPQNYKVLFKDNSLKAWEPNYPSAKP